MALKLLYLLKHEHTPTPVYTSLANFFIKMRFSEACTLYV